MAFDVKTITEPVKEALYKAFGSDVNITEEHGSGKLFYTIFPSDTDYHNFTMSYKMYEFRRGKGVGGQPEIKYTLDAVIHYDMLLQKFLENYTTRYGTPLKQEYPDLTDEEWGAIISEAIKNEKFVPIIDSMTFNSVYISGNHPIGRSKHSIGGTKEGVLIERGNDYYSNDPILPSSYGISRAFAHRFNKDRKIIYITLTSLSQAISFMIDEDEGG